MKDLKMPKVVNKTNDEVEAIINAINSSALSKEIKEFAISCIRLACWFPLMLQRKKITISRLKAMIFGKKKIRKKKNADEPDDGSGTSSNDSEADALAGSNNNDKGTKSRKPGSKPSGKTTPPNNTGKNKGRNAHTVYKNANEVWHTIDGMKPGSPCPLELCTGKMYPQPAGIVVCVDGQPMILEKAVKNIRYTNSLIIKGKYHGNSAISHSP